MDRSAARRARPVCAAGGGVAVATRASAAACWWPRRLAWRAICPRQVHWASAWRPSLWPAMSSTNFDRGWIRISCLRRLAVIWLAVTAIALMEGAVWRLMSETTLSWPTLAVRGATVGVYTAAVGLPLLMLFNRCPRRAGTACCSRSSALSTLGFGKVRTGSASDSWNSCLDGQQRRTLASRKSRGTLNSSRQALAGMSNQRSRESCEPDSAQQSCASASLAAGRLHCDVRWDLWPPGGT